MNLLSGNTSLYTDMYQLTMMQSYLSEGIHNRTASFDYFFRKLPFEGGYVIFAGLTELLEYIGDIKFSKDDIDYLSTLNFKAPFLEWLETFSFKGNITSVEEGSVIFSNEPVVSVTGSIAEAQLVETLLLNILNFNSLIATKASRIRLSAPGKILSEFGLRRAQGLGGIQAARAAIIGGFDSTSNVLASKLFNLVPAGTMAHSYIVAHDDELTAFRKFTELYPSNSILLVDTYNTLLSGVPNAITAAQELEKKGGRVLGIRLDSGDLAYLSKEARKMLDAAGLNYIKIVASNQLDEHVIKSLIEQDAPIDIFGVGTSLVTGQPDGALDGVYKLSMFDGNPRLKISETIGKITLPGSKKIIRFKDDEGFYQADAIILEGEPHPKIMYHPQDKEKSMSLEHFRPVEMYKRVMRDGVSEIKTCSPSEIRERVKENLSHLPLEYKRFINPHIYKVGISLNILNLRDNLKNM